MRVEGDPDPTKNGVYYLHADRLAWHGHGVQVSGWSESKQTLDAFVNATVKVARRDVAKT
jgi:hypothetical protein